jgi:hypothetical protein
VDTLLGLIGILVWIVCVIALAATVTWAIVKLFPGRKPAPQAESTEGS